MSQRRISDVVIAFAAFCACMMTALPARAQNASDPDCTPVRQQVSSLVQKIRTAATPEGVDKAKELAETRLHAWERGSPGTAATPTTPAVPATPAMPHCVRLSTAADPAPLKADLDDVSRTTITGAANYAKARLLENDACEKSKDIIAKAKSSQFEAAHAVLWCEFHGVKEECFDEKGHERPAPSPTLNIRLKELEAEADGAGDAAFSARVTKIAKCFSDAKEELEKRETEVFASSPCGLDDKPNRSRTIGAKKSCFVIGVIPATLSFVRIFAGGLSNYSGGASSELLSVAVPYAGFRWAPFQSTRVLSFDFIFYSAYLTSAGVRNAVNGSSKACSSASGASFEAALGCQGEASVAPYIGFAPTISIGERSIGYVSWAPGTIGLARVGTDGFRSAIYYGTLLGIVSLTRTF